MKNGLEEAGLLDSVHLMCQPLAFKTPDAGKKTAGKIQKFKICEIIHFTEIFQMNIAF